MSVFNWLEKVLDEQTIPWKSVIVFISVAQFSFETYLTYRQYKVLSGKKLPAVLENEIDQETFVKTEVYAKAKAKFSVVTSVISLAQKIAFIHYDMFPHVWNLSVHAATYLPNMFHAVSTIPQSLYFLLGLTLISNVLDLPVSYYQHFVLEEKFGFNKLTVGLWIKDMIKGNLLAFSIGGPFLYGFLKIFDKFQTNFLWYICLFIFVVQILAMVLVPVYIMPLFNKFTPLEDGELKTSIENLAKRVSFPLDKIFVVDGSKRSSHSNAYFTGLPFTSKRIVLFDTLINDSNVEEITAVLAHEIGHWQKNHILRMIVISQLHIFSIFSLFTVVYHNSSFYNSFGFFAGQSTLLTSSATSVVTPELPIIIGFMLFNDLLTPMECAMQFLMNLLSRFHEYEADAYAKELNHAKNLCKALITLQIKNLSTMNVDPLYSSYHYSHPTLAERLTALCYISDKKKA